MPTRIDIQDVMSDLKEIVKSDTIIRFNLVDGAKKILVKMITEYGLNPEKFLTIAEIRRNFRSLSTQDAEIVILELRDLGLLEAKIRGKSLIVFRYNFSKVVQDNLLAKDRQETLKHFVADRQARRIAHHERMLKNLRKTKEVGYERSSEEILTKADVDALSALPKTPFELHRDKECNSDTCRFCAIEQDKAIGF